MESALGESFTDNPNIFSDIDQNKDGRMTWFSTDTVISNYLIFAWVRLDFGVQGRLGYMGMNIK